MLTSRAIRSDDADLVCRRLHGAVVHVAVGTDSFAETVRGPPSIEGGIEPLAKTLHYCEQACVAVYARPALRNYTVCATAHTSSVS